jgi:hypothetical protein
VSRVRLAIEACRRMGEQCAEGGDIQKARDIAEHVHTLSCLRSALRARHDDGLHVEEGIYTGAHPGETRQVAGRVAPSGPFNGGA